MAKYIWCDCSYPVTDYDEHDGHCNEDADDIGML